MKAHISMKTRVFLIGMLLVTLGMVAGYAQPKAEERPAADRPLVSSSGVLVAQVQADSPAAKAGIVRGDIILEVQGTAVDTPRDLKRALDGRKAGDALSVKLRHGDAVKTVTLTLGTEQDGPWVGIVCAPTELAMGRMMMPGLGGMGREMLRAMPFGMAMPATTDVKVISVAGGSPAEKAGLKEGDLIISVDGTRFDDRHTLSEMIGAKKVGDTVTLSVQSTGQEAPRDVKVTLAKHPDKDGAWLGVGYRWDWQWRTSSPQGGPVSMMAGVLVADVADNGPAAKAGIKARDIITAVEGVAVDHPQLVADAVATHKTGDTLLLTVYRMADDKETDVTVTLGQKPDDAAKAYLGVTMSSFVGFEGMPFRGPEARNAPGTGGGQPGGPRASGDMQDSPTI